MGARMARFKPLTLTDLPDGVWRTRILVRFGHCDPAGIIYTPEYFNLFNGAAEDWYGEALGVSYHDLVGKRRIGLGYAHVSADFAKPSSMGDVLDAAIIVRQIGRASFTFTVHGFTDGVERVRCTFVSVTTSLIDHKPIALPDDLRGGLTAYQARCGNAAEGEPVLVEAR
jgi:acyl-CoA thioesterase FadM